jgi:hypothetical protein
VPKQFSSGFASIRIHRGYISPCHGLAPYPGIDFGAVDSEENWHTMTSDDYTLLYTVNASDDTLMFAFNWGSDTRVNFGWMQAQ